MSSSSTAREQNLASLLEQTCHLTNAAWAVWVSRASGRWEALASYRVRKNLLGALTDFLQQDAVDMWMCGAFSSKALRSRTLPLDGLPARHVTLFPLSGSLSAVLVGGELGSEARRFWRALLKVFAQQESQADQPSLLPLVEKLLADLPHLLENLFGEFLSLTQASSGWLGIHQAERLEIRLQHNCPLSQGKTLNLESDPLLSRLVRARQALALQADQPEWPRIPFMGKEVGQVGGWLALPFFSGRRLTAVMVFWRPLPFLEAERRSLQEEARNLGALVDVALLFEEMAGYLHRLALLNDFALTISASQNVEQIIRRTFALLQRSFKTDQALLLLLIADQKTVREYRSGDARPEMRLLPLDEHPLREYLQAKRRSHLLELSDGEEMRSMVLAPLRYRGQSIGLLALQSRTPGAFKTHDEQLLGLLGSHLAALIEYGRLREEAEARARRLGLIHEVIEQIVGLTNLQEILQIVADLLAEYFAYEFTQVELFGPPPRFGRGGKRPEFHNPDQSRFAFSRVLVQRMLEKGESLVLNALPKNPGAAEDWQPAAAIIVPLRSAMGVIGAIQVASHQTNAFSEIDLVALESLAGILTAVIHSVEQYASLQSTVQALRSTQAELEHQIEIQKLTERRLLQAAKLAAVGEMAAGVAHELNNPLTTVTGFSELVLEELPPDSPAREDMQLILREARRAREVVRRLLDFARQSEVTRTRYDVNEIVRDVLALVTHLLHTSGVRHVLALDEHLPWVYVNVNQIKQVLLNLIHNALQAMPLGGELTLTTARRQREERQWVTLSVRDTGIGILPEHRERIFEPFFTTRAAQGGTGLGLSISYSIIADHGGMIEVESEPGKGACFTVWLPT